MHHPRLPQPRGPLTSHLCDRLEGRPRRLHLCLEDDPLVGEDSQLALHICYGLHYDGFAGVDESWEWEPTLIELRGALERRFLRALTDEARARGAAPGVVFPTGEAAAEVRALLAAEGGPSLSTFMATRGTVDQLREFVVHRSVYQRKEADAHTWAIPRLRGRAKSALVTLQTDEYGQGAPGQSHAELFAATMTALDLDPRPGVYIDQVPGVTLATDNLVSFLGLHRRWRGALVGHLAAFEMTSVTPMGRYADAVRRLTGDERAAEFYDVHVVADVRHEVIAAEELIGGMVASDPDAAADIPFGVAALLGCERRFAGHLLDAWDGGRSSLREPEGLGAFELRIAG